MTDELRIGIAGYGPRGEYLAGCAHRPELGARVTGVFDARPEAREAFVEKHGADATASADLDQLLESVDALVVATPDFLHADNAAAALEAGVAVYLEKPMATTIAGCDRVLEAAMKTGARLYVGHNMRGMAFTIKMKQLIESGAIGEVRTAWSRHFTGRGGDAYFKDWHAERANITGLLIHKASHDIDVLHWLCGGYSTRVHAMGGLTVYGDARRRQTDEPYDKTTRLENWPPLSQTGMSPVMDVEDLSLMQMQLDNGTYACYQECHYTPDTWRNFCIVGTAGRIENFGDKPGDCTIRVWNTRTMYDARGNEEHHVTGETGHHGGADVRLVEEFIRFVREGGATMTSPIAARNAVAAGAAATDSLRSGGVPIDIPPLPEAVLAYFDGGQQTTGEVAEGGGAIPPSTIERRR
jgi:predicted dehydrogenase